MVTFFAGGTRTEFGQLPGGGRLAGAQITAVTALTKEQLERVGTKLKGVLCSKGCGRAFEHAPARVHHEKTCTGGNGYGTPAAVAAAAAEVAAAETVAAEAVAAEATAAAAASDGEDVPPPLAKAPKIRKDGDVKQSGLREGDKKGINHTLYFKLGVVRTLRKFQTIEKLGLQPNGWKCAGLEVSAVYNDLSPSNISKWGKAEDELHEALMHEHRVGRKQKNRAGTMASFQSRGARRTTLHRGRAPPFAAVEV